MVASDESYRSTIKAFGDLLKVTGEEFLELSAKDLPIKKLEKEVDKILDHLDPAIGTLTSELLHGKEE